MSEQTTPRKPLTLHRLREMPTLAQKVTQTLTIPVIGIGASVACSGQVLVLHDMLAVSHGKRPRFVRNFMDGSASVQCAVQCYVEDVKASRFPVENIHTC